MWFIVHKLIEDTLVCAEMRLVVTLNKGPKLFLIVRFFSKHDIRMFTSL